MTNHGTCGLCITHPASQKRIHAYGVPLCESCWLGHIDDALIGRGISVRSEIFEGGSGRNRYFRHVVEAKVANVGPVDVRFVRATLLQRCIAAFGSSLRAGDPLFDDHVVVRAARSELAEKLVANDGLQTAVLEIVQRDDLAIQGGRVTCSFIEKDPDAPALKELGRNVAVVLHHVQRLSAS